MASEARNMSAEFSCARGALFSDYGARVDECQRPAAHVSRKYASNGTAGAKKEPRTANVNALFEATNQAVAS
jgi:hypothetical protein